ncbi:hypothetical protein CR513_50070, partial [Mucuna pruriens]
MKGLKKFWLPKSQILVSNVLVGKVPLHTIDKVLYVESRKYNLFSIRQFCDNEFNVSFNKNLCVVDEVITPLFSLPLETTIFIRLILRI